MPAVGEHLTAKDYVDHAISYSVDESSLLELHPNEKLKLSGQGSIVLNSTLTSPKTIIKIPTKSYVNSLHESCRNRRDLSSVINDQDKYFDNNKITNLDSVTVNRNPSSDNELANKKYVDESFANGNILGINKTLQRYLKLSFGNNVYNLTKYVKVQIIDTTIFKYPNTSG